MGNWNEEKVTEVVNKKQTVCKHFLEAIDGNNMAGFKCTLEGVITVYILMHFLLDLHRKTFLKKEENEDGISLDHVIESEHSVLGPTVAKITLESLLAWKKRKRQEKIGKPE